MNDKPTSAAADVGDRLDQVLRRIVETADSPLVREWALELLGVAQPAAPAVKGRRKGHRSGPPTATPSQAG